MTSNDIKTTQTKSNKKNKNVLKTRSIQEDIEINEHYLDEILRNNNTWTLICVIIPLYSYSYISMVLVLWNIVFIHFW